MTSVRERSALLLIAVLTVSSLIIVESAFAQSAPKPSVPEFTIRIAAYPYDVPPTTTTTIDPYTGKETVTTQPGYHVENKSMEAVINNNLGASYYNFRWKGHYSDKWNYYPFNPNDVNGYSLHNTAADSPKFRASASDYTVVSLYFLPTDVIEGGLIDAQVQALFGGFRKVYEGNLIIGATYNFYFIGTTSDWSETVTFFYDLTSPMVSMLSPEQNASCTSDVSLSFTVNEEFNQTEYSLDGMENVTISGNTTLTNLPIGQHSITVYAMDRAGNIGASEAVNFTVAVPFSTTTLIVIVLVSVFAIGAGLLLYFKKRKH